MLSARFKDELHPEAEIEKLLTVNGPMLGSYKLDGIRAISWPTGQGSNFLATRFLNRLRNNHLAELYSRKVFQDLDGEIICGPVHGQGVYDRTFSATQTIEGFTPDVKWWIFDWHTLPHGFAVRYNEILKRVSEMSPVVAEFVQILEHRYLHTVEEVLAFEQNALKQEYEGIILRHPHMPYKYNRSTMKQAGMIKLKRFVESEAKIVGFYELMRNANEPTIDDRGFQVRSSHKAGQVGGETLGGFHCVDVTSGIEFDCGSGLDMSTRGTIWANQDQYLGKIFTYRSMPYGVKDKPRHPTFRRWRAADDLAKHP